jgi:hypothetical protein
MLMRQRVPRFAEQTEDRRAVSGSANGWSLYQSDQRGAGILWRDVFDSTERWPHSGSCVWRARQGSSVGRSLRVRRPPSLHSHSEGHTHTNTHTHTHTHTQLLDCSRRRGVCSRSPFTILHCRYQRLACQARLRESSEQIAAMRRGLTAIIPTPLIRMWTAAELELAVCGTPDIPVDELRRTARYSIDREAPEVAFMFEALEGMSNEDRSLFLRFVTGRARLPASIKICSLNGSASSLPVSHTCFNQIGKHGRIPLPIPASTAYPVPCCICSEPTPRLLASWTHIV